MTNWVCQAICGPGWAQQPQKNMMCVEEEVATPVDVEQDHSQQSNVHPSDDFSDLRHIFKLDATKLTYELNMRPIPKPILQMAYLRLFIPLSLLMTTVLDKIQFNDGLKFHKIYFGTGTGKHTLDITTFPNELSLTETEFWQACCNWISLIKMIAEPAIADGSRLEGSPCAHDVRSKLLCLVCGLART